MYVRSCGEVKFLRALGVAERKRTVALELREAEFEAQANFKKLERISSPPSFAFSLVNRRGQPASFSAICV